MRNAVPAIAVSLAVHLAAALALGWALCRARTVALPKLDLTSVELSLAETEAAPSPGGTPPAPDRAPPPSPSSQPPVLPAPAEFPPPTPSPPKPPSPRVAPPAPPPPLTAPAPPLTAPAPPLTAPAPPAARVEATPSPRRAITPRYPKTARQRGEQGDVTLALRVTAEGTVAEATVIRSSGYAALDQAARDAAKGASFTPATADGRPIPSQARLTLRFRLKDATR